ncbi:PepSY domain-containing protein [Enterococcus sp. AZ103]|uniref:PepSY domain-containing protein n=1 Tax=Enterococcus sp. AZ103 TaxID=2774628 RepID=UPI003F296D9E
MIKHTKKIIAGVAAVAVVGIAGGLVYANSNASETKQMATVNTSQIKVTQEEAIEQFNQQFEGKELNQVELEVSRAGYVYTVEGFDDTTDYTLKIDAQTGSVVGHETDPKDQEDMLEAEYTLNLDGIITRDEASKIAEDQAKRGEAKEWALDQTSTDGTTWEVKVIDGTYETEVTINALTGDVVGVDVDDEAYDD